MRRSLLVASALAALACRRGDQPDAYGSFEATEVVVSAQTGGQLLQFDAAEGQTVRVGAVVAVVDTTQLVLERQQLLAQRAASGSRVNEVTQQASALAVQYDVARRNYERTKRLFDEQAATAQQLDQAEREFRVLAEQIDGARALRQTVSSEAASTEARVAQLGDRIAKSRITNPLGGVVLATYAERGEYVQPGQPLYKVAALDTLVLRAYITEPQLALVKLGQKVRVNVDRGDDDRAAVTGTVSWVSSKAEFTPTPIQTRDERADLVYAVKIVVPNPDGVLKIGMPADVDLPASGEDS